MPSIFLDRPGEPCDHDNVFKPRNEMTAGEQIRDDEIRRRYGDEMRAIRETELADERAWEVWVRGKLGSRAATGVEILEGLQG